MYSHAASWMCICTLVFVRNSRRKCRRRPLAATTAKRAREPSGKNFAARRLCDSWIPGKPLSGAGVFIVIRWPDARGFSVPHMLGVLPRSRLQPTWDAPFAPFAGVPLPLSASLHAHEPGGRHDSCACCSSARLGRSDLAASRYGLVHHGYGAPERGCA